MAARRIYSEDLVLNLIINGKDMPAQNKVALNELYKLDRKTRELEIQLAKNEVATRNLSKSSKTYSTDLKRLEDEHKKLTKQINLNHAAMNKLRQEIGRSGLTINQLNSQLKMFKIQLNNATDPGVMRRLRKEIILTENRIKQLATGASRMSIAFERMGTVANKFGSITGYLAIVGYAFGRAVGGTVKTLRELDKEFSNVMKSTDLTRQEMWALKQQFDQINMDDSMKTPTATKDLLEIARIAGRLGVRGVKDIADFTMSVDKLYVALGEDLKGSVEDVAEKIGKLVNTFRLTDEMPLGEAMLRAGSLINELSKRSAAGAETILDYTSRLGGVGSMAKFTMDQLAGLGATLDAVGVPAERGSTALMKLITGMGSNAEEFSRTLGMTTEEYTKAMETNINDTMLMLLKSSAQGNKSIMDVVAGMDQMDLSGVRVIEVYGKLVQNMDMVIEQQEIAANAFQSSASVVNEFYIMSKDFDSLMAIQGKRWKALGDSYAKSVAPAVYKVYRAFTDLAFAIKNSFIWLSSHINVIIAFITAWAAFKSGSIARGILTILVNLKVWTVELYRNTQMALLNNVAINKMYIAYTKAGRGIAGITAAMKALWGVMITNPFTAIIAVLGIVASAFFLLKKRGEELNNVLVKFNAEVQTEVDIMGELFKRVKETAEGTEERKEAIGRLNTVYGQYLPRLLSEKNSILEIESAQKSANIALRESIALRIKETDIAAINQKIYDKTKKQVKSILEDSERINKFKDKTTVAALSGQAEGELMILLRRMQDKGYMDIAAIEKFIKDWDIKYTNALLLTPYEKIRRVFDVFKEGKDEIDTTTAKLDKFLSTVAQATGLTKAENEAGISMMSDNQYESQKKMIENASTMRENELMQQKISQKKTDDWFEKEVLKSEEQKIRDLLQLEEAKWTKIITVDKDGVIEQQKQLMTGVESSEEYVKLQNDLLKNQISQGKPAGGKAPSIKKQMEEGTEEGKQLLTNYYLWGRITKEQYDAALVDLEEKYWAMQMVKFKEGSDEYLDAYQKWLDTQVKQKEAAEKVKEQIGKAVAWALSDETWEKGKKENPQEQENQEDLNIAEDLIEKRKRVRQFLSLDKNRGTEAEFAVFDTEDFAGQLLQIKAWEKDLLNSHEEYERRKTEITKEQEKARLKYVKEGLNAVSDLLSSVGNLYEAQKNKELAQVEEVEEKKGGATKATEEQKAEITKKYAKKQQQISIAQAVIRGAMAIMDLFGNNMIPWPARQIYNAIMIPLIITTTAMEIAAIKKQQFEKGNYPEDITDAQGKYKVIGEDDHKVYEAGDVGRVETGIYENPSVGLFAEKPEMVVDNDTLENIKKNDPSLIGEILHYRDSSVRAKEDIPIEGDTRDIDRNIVVNDRRENRSITDNISETRNISETKGELPEISEGGTTHVENDFEFISREGNEHFLDNVFTVRNLSETNGEPMPAPEGEDTEVNRNFLVTSHQQNINTTDNISQTRNLSESAGEPMLAPEGEDVSKLRTVVYPVDIVRKYMYGIGGFMGYGNTEDEERVKGRVKQFSAGTYPVVGEDDRKTYKAEYVGPVRTGLYRKPSLGLFAEKPEMVIDYPTLRNIQMNNPRIIEAILAYRVKGPLPGTQTNGKKIPQFADGNYHNAVPDGGEKQAYDPEIKELLRRNIEMQEKLMTWKPKVYTELIKRDLDTLDKIERNRGL
jgi:TP901 family phage tail tape measure protein